MLILSRRAQLVANIGVAISLALALVAPQLVFGAVAVSNPSFESYTSGWSFYSAGSAAFSIGPGYTGERAAQLSVIREGVSTQLYQDGFTLQANTAYRITLAAYSNTGHDLTVSVHQDVSPFAAYGLSGYKLDLSKSWQTYTIDFTTSGFSGTVSDARVSLELAPYAEQGDTYWVDDVSITSGGTGGCTPGTNCDGCTPGTNCNADTTPPVATVTHTLTTVPGTDFRSKSLQIDATAQDASGVASLEIFVNDTSVKRCVATPVYPASPCSVTVGPYAPGSTVTYYAIAVDSSVNANQGRAPANQPYITVVIPGTQPPPPPLGTADDAFVQTEHDLVTKVNTELVDRLLGYMLLQVEEKGQVWYLDPVTKLKYYLPDGDAAYSALRKFGLGITNSDLAQIPVGLVPGLVAADTDGDTLPDKLEQALGTDPLQAETNSSGISDVAQILAKPGMAIGVTPVPALERNLEASLKGHILLQVEGKGEAWYVNPKDGLRYYLADGASAYQVMRYLSLGITNSDIRSIPVGFLAGCTPGTNCGDDTTPPTVDVTHILVHPPGTDPSKTSVQVNATAQDESGIASLEVFVNSISARRCVTDPSHSASPCSITTGSYASGTTVTYYAIATDASPRANMGRAPTNPAGVEVLLIP